jgi:hypothetical protein
VIGNLLAAFVLQSFSLITFYFVMAGFAGISVVIFVLLKNPIILHVPTVIEESGLQ